MRFRIGLGWQRTGGNFWFASCTLDPANTQELRQPSIRFAEVYLWHESCGYNDKPRREGSASLRADSVHALAAKQLGRVHVVALKETGYERASFSSRQC